MEETNITELTAQIAAAYVGKNNVTIDQIPEVIATTRNALLNGEPIANGDRSVQPSKQEIKRSITDDYLISFEDGKPYKSLKRHLRTHYDLSPEEYREKWGLPRDYPMVAPSYSESRRELAKKIGLGRREPVVETPSRKKRGS